MSPHAAADIVLRTRRFRTAAAHDIDFELRRGEILGIGGLVGHGQEDFMMGLDGAVPANADQFRVFTHGREARTSPFAKVADAQRRRSRLGIPADRRKEVPASPAFD